MLMPRWRITSASVAPSMGSTVWSVKSFTCRLQQVRPLPAQALCLLLPQVLPIGGSRYSGALRKEGTKTPLLPVREGKQRKGCELSSPAFAQPPSPCDCWAHWQETAVGV